MFFPKFSSEASALYDLNITHGSTLNFYEWVPPVTLELVSCLTPLLYAGPTPVGVSKWPQPSLNITLLQNRKREEGEENSSNQKRSKNLSENSFFFLSFFFFRIQCVCLTPFWFILRPRAVLVERTAGGALSVCKLDDMAIVCVWAYMEAPTALRMQPVWSLRSGESPSVELRAFLSSDFLHLTKRSGPSLWVAWMWCTTKAMERTTSLQRRTRRRTTTTITSNNRWDSLWRLWRI